MKLMESKRLKNMQIKEIIPILEKMDPEARILIACDEELNTIYNRFEVTKYGNDYVIFGLSGSEENKDFEDEEDFTYESEDDFTID
jgi:hypothetical protein